MHRTPVQSSVITSVGYDPESRLLEVEFTTGNLYHYFRVPADVHEALMAAPSVGTYFNTEIRDRYPVGVIGDPEPT